MKTKVSHYSQKFSIYIVLVALFIVCSMLSPYFLNSNNLINVSRQLSVGILIAYGEMLLIISGFLDLSVGSVLALAGVLSVSTYQQTQSMTAAVLVALVVAVSCNIVNAFFVANCNVPAFIATLGMQQAARGIALYYTNGQNILQLGDFVEDRTGNGRTDTCTCHPRYCHNGGYLVCSKPDPLRTRDLCDRRKQKRCRGQRNQFQEKHL